MPLNYFPLVISNDSHSANAQLFLWPISSCT